MLGRRSFAQLVLVVIALAGVACAPAAPPAPAPSDEGKRVAAELPKIDETRHETASAATSTSALTRVDDPSLLCMLSGRYFGKPQVPTQVDGHTYYGCCAGCAARLAQNPDARSARDPHNGHVVDKANAVIARSSDNRVMYFESAESLAAFQLAK